MKNLISQGLVETLDLGKNPRSGNTHNVMHVSKMNIHHASLVLLKWSLVIGCKLASLKIGMFHFLICGPAQAPKHKSFRTACLGRRPDPTDRISRGDRLLRPMTRHSRPRYSAPATPSIFWPVFHCAGMDDILPD